jgi:glycerate dehydrogenase
MNNIVFLDRNSLSPNAKIRQLAASASWQFYDSTSEQELVQRCTDADVLVLSKTRISEQTLAACPSIKHIAIAATGFNIVDIKACKNYRVSVSIVPAYANTSVAEHVINYALCLRRQLIQYRQQVVNGAWQESVGFCLFDKPILDLAGTTLGIVGFGSLGQATAKLATAMGMKVIFSARRPVGCSYADQVEFEQLIESADIISLHCSLNESTRNLIDKSALKRMQKHAILINTARGGIVDESALVEAIENNEIAGIGIDVLQEEPPKQNSPLLKIADQTNVIITPHTAWASEQAMSRLTDILADNIDAFLLGESKNLVTGPYE